MATGPYVAQHLYLQWGGVLPGNEQWSCGMRFSSPNPQDEQPITNGQLDTVQNAMVAFHGNASAAINSNAKLNFVKLNLIGLDGKYVFPTTNERVVQNVSGGGSGTPLYPNQVALVVSLTTDVTRGPASKGRFYLPLPTTPLEPDGRITDYAATNVGTAVDTLLASLNNFSLTWRAAVFSRKVGAPASRLITGCRIGKVLDTQRRRRASLIEQYK